MADKYNYDTALELLKDAYNANVKVTYKDENADFDNMKLQSIEVIEN